MDHTLFAFLGTAALIIVTPGPDTATTIRNALRHGRRGALLTPLGTGSAILVHATVAAFGLSSLLRTAAGLYTVVRFCGAAYLIFIGIQAFRSARQPNDGNHSPAGREKAAIIFSGAPYWQGFLSAILNPKLVVFFATFLPQFIAPEQAVLPRMLFLGATFDLMVIIWLMGYGVCVTITHRFFSAPAVRRRMERLTGVVLIALGARIALEKS